MMAERLENHHSEYLDSRRALLDELRDPFKVPPVARVVQESSPLIKRKDPGTWRRFIVATVFWVGEQPTARNPTPNNKSSWDMNWLSNFGGIDRPSLRNGYLPRGFTPKQTPFYVALPYNDILPDGSHRPEASEVIPWFHSLNPKPYQSACNGKWIAIHHRGRVCFARWRDAGPWTTDDYDYVFLNKRPRPNPNGDAGIDISPAVRDYLGLISGHRVDWRFAEDGNVPDGPWKNWLPPEEADSQ